MAKASLELGDILETCTIVFKQRLANLIKFGNKGKLLMIRHNTNLEEQFKVSEFKSAVFELTNKDLETKIKQALNHSPTKLILFEYKETLAGVVDELRKIKFDWFFSIESDDQGSVASYAKENQIFGLVYNIQADSKWVCSVNNSSAVLANGVTIDGSNKITGLDLLPVVGGLCAGCPYDMSISGFVLSELESVEMPEKIVEGQITLYNEEEGVRVASPVNTLTTLSKNDTEDMKSLTLLEVIMRFVNDVKYSFRT